MNGCQSTASGIISTFKMLFMLIFSFRASVFLTFGVVIWSAVVCSGRRRYVLLHHKNWHATDIEEEHYHHFFNLCNSRSSLGLIVVNKLNLTRGGLAGRNQFQTCCENPKWGAPFSFIVFISVFHAIFAPTSNAKKINR